MKTKPFTRRRIGSLAESLSDLLTPHVWKQAKSARGCRRNSSRWTTQPLVLTLVLTTWCCGDSQAERFEAAKAFCVVCTPKRRRPGKTVEGFQKALAKMPTAVLRTVAAGVRQILASRLAACWLESGFVPIGCDGTRQECPRTAELEARLGKAGKKNSAPTIWITALVHLRLGVPWAWRIGKGNASERAHLLAMLPLLPKAALLIADAGYFGFDLTKSLVDNQVSFLLRMSSNVTLYTREQVALPRFEEGEFFYFPSAQRPSEAPLRLRLIRVRGRTIGKQKRRGDVWLLTNVMDSQRLSHAAAADFYRRRWESEGQFRAYKRTLSKVKLLSRTVRLVHREAEGSLLALQVMLAQGALAMGPARTKTGDRPMCSPRKIQLAIRDEMEGRRHPGGMTFRQRLSLASRERRSRTSPKSNRLWPRRKPHKPPRPPKLLKLTGEKLSMIRQLERTSM